MVVISIVVFLISLSLVIVLHELGHFIMARRAGILCHEFSLGMGPVLFSTKRGETTYSIRAIPLGGYVMMAGEEIDDELVKEGQQVRLQFEGNKVSKIIVDHEDEQFADLELVRVDKVDLKGKDMTPLYLNEYDVKRDAFIVMKGRELQIAPYERGFGGKSILQRFLAIFGGPFMNFVLAVFVFLVINLIVGFPNMDTSTIGSVGAGFPADGMIEEGDQILSIDGQTVNDWDDLSIILDQNSADRLLDFVVLRDGEEVTVTLTPVIYFYNVGFHSDQSAVDDLIVGEINEGTKADQAGLLQGDELVSIDGTPVTTWEDVITELESIASENYQEDRGVSIIVNRDGSTEIVTIVEPYTAAFLESQGLDVVDTRIGISPEFEFSAGKSVVGSFGDVGRSASVIFTTLGLLFDSDGAGAGIGVDSLAGPVGIYQITSQALEQGVISLLGWVGLLSVNLGIVNLLPIPALDGGRLVFLGYEAVTKKKPNAKVENTLHYVMYLALLGLFVFITFNDILRLFNLK